MKQLLIFLASVILVAGPVSGGSVDVYPRVITPNGDGINDRIFFVVDNPTDVALEGQIYDVNSKTVSKLFISSIYKFGATILYWDGTHSGGSFVPGGLYIYRIKAPKKDFTGTLVVVK